MNSREKGKRGELELAHELNRLLGMDTRRGQQYCGATGDADVIGLPGVHIECKRVEHLNIDTAMHQSLFDRRDGEFATVMHRRNRQKWLVTMPLEEWCILYKEHQEGLG